MNEYKQCPWCAESIRLEAVKCRYCGSMVSENARLRGLSEPWMRPLGDRMVAGVCAGLADQFGVSVTILRLAFVLGVLFSGGVFLLVYLVLWVAMPAELDPLYDPGPRRARGDRDPDELDDPH